MKNELLNPYYDDFSYHSYKEEQFIYLSDYISLSYKPDFEI